MAIRLPKVATTTLGLWWQIIKFPSTGWESRYLSRYAKPFWKKIQPYHHTQEQPWESIRQFEDPIWDPQYNCYQEGAFVSESE